MDVRFLGTGGPAGWPEPGCRCASCQRARAAGETRGPAAALVSGRLRLAPGQPPRLTGEARDQVEPVPGGWAVTGPDGTRLLAAAGPGAVPDPPAGSAPFDIVLLDLLDRPEQLGALRARGLARPGAIAAPLYADHRVASAAELARRCGFWLAAAPGDGDVLSAGPGVAAAARPGETAAAGPDETAAAGGSLTVPAARPRPHRTLILGGARSGKSSEAELRLAAEPDVTYVAAGPWPDGAAASGEDGPDDEWARRVAAHQAARPSWWPTLETTDVAGVLRRAQGAVLIDGIGTWLTAAMTEAGAWDGGDEAAGRVAGRVGELVAAWRQTSALVVAVSDEVGSGVVPATAAGRLFRDQLGWLNQRLAAESEQAVLVVAGRVLSLPT